MQTESVITKEPDSSAVMEPVLPRKRKNPACANRNNEILSNLEYEGPASLPPMPIGDQSTSPLPLGSNFRRTQSTRIVSTSSRSRSADPGSRYNHHHLMTQSYPDAGVSSSKISEYKSSFVAWPSRLTHFALSPFPYASDVPDGTVSGPCSLETHREEPDSPDTAAGGRRSEYRAKYRPFSNYVYVDGLWRRATPTKERKSGAMGGGGGGGDVTDSRGKGKETSWYDEVVERIHTAQQYRTRSRSSGLQHTDYPDPTSRDLLWKEMEANLAALTLANSGSDYRKRKPRIPLYKAIKPKVDTGMKGHHHTTVDGDKKTPQKSSSATVKQASSPTKGPSKSPTKPVKSIGEKTDNSKETKPTTTELGSGVAPADSGGTTGVATKPRAVVRPATSGSAPTDAAAEGKVWMKPAAKKPAATNGASGMKTVSPKPSTVAVGPADHSGHLSKHMTSPPVKSPPTSLNVTAASKPTGGAKTTTTTSSSHQQPPASMTTSMSGAGAATASKGGATAHPSTTTAGGGAGSSSSATAAPPKITSAGPYSGMGSHPPRPTATTTTGGAPAASASLMSTSMMAPSYKPTATAAPSTMTSSMSGMPASMMTSMTGSLGGKPIAAAVPTTATVKPTMTSGGVPQAAPRSGDLSKGGANPMTSSMIGSTNGGDPMDMARNRLDHFWATGK